LSSSVGWATLHRHVFIRAQHRCVVFFDGRHISAKTPNMDKLTKGEQDNIKKMSDASLESCLMRCGISLDEVEYMDRNSMINKWVELVAAKADKPATATVSTVCYDVAVGREKLQSEKFKFEHDLKFEGNWKQPKYSMKRKN
jgi:hypothetical protein